MASENQIPNSKVDIIFDWPIGQLEIDKIAQANIFIKI